LKIKILATSISRPGGFFANYGDIIDVPDALGLQFIKSKLAQKVKDKKKIKAKK
jgi:hypothetical protein